MKKLYIIWACAMLLTFIKCIEREWDSPYDPDTPKEAWSPSGLQAAREGNAIVLTWQQSNKKISGFVISRNENDGAMQEVARPGKEVTRWSDSNITGGKKYGYQVLAYAGDNMSNASSTQITVTTTASITTSTTTATSCNSASSGGNISSDGGTQVTARGVCWNTSTGPTVNNSKTTDGTGQGIFNSTITGLSGNTTYYVRAYATNAEGTVYGNEVNLTTPPCASVPTVTTATVTNATQTTATGGGNVTADGGATVTAKGICWATTQNPTVSNPKTVDGDGLGIFTSSITGLTAATTYYVRAYATNSAGTAYGNQVSFPTLPPAVVASLTTQTPSDVTCNSAGLGGRINEDGGAAITEKGIVYGTNRNPTTANTKVPMVSGTTNFTQIVTGFSENTTYYVRAYAINSAGTAYGQEEFFTTPPCATGPVVTTTQVSSVNCTSAVSGGNITNDGGLTITARGVCWGTSPNPTTAGNKTSNGTGKGIFSSTLTGLTSGTMYYYRAYATNSITTSYGQEGYFFSTPVPATVQASSPTDISCNSAVLSGRINNDGGIAPTEVGIVYALTQNPTTAHTKIVMSNSGGSWSQPVSGFNGSTTYYIRAYAINCAGTAYSNQVTLNTPACAAIPSVTTTVATGLTCTGFTSGGNVTSDGGSTVTARGVCWGTSPSPTITGNKTSNGSSTGSFTSSITGLAINTVYYYRAYATNSVSTAYGQEYTVRTPYLPTVSTATPLGVTCNSATLGGNVTADGGATVTERGIVYALTQYPTTANTKVAIGSGTGSYNQSVTGLAGSTTYYVRAYAINCSGTIYGSQTSFTTQATTLATVTTSTPASIMDVSAVLGGNVTSQGGTPVTERGIVYATTLNPTVNNTKVTMGSGTGVYSNTVSGLSPDVTYHARAYAINCGGVSYGADVSFKTAVGNFYITDARVSPTTVYPGTSLTITCTHNLSVSSKTVYSPYVGIFRSSDAIWDGSDVLVASKLTYLGGSYGTSSSLTGGAILPLEIPSGKYYILFVPDYRKEYAETNESDFVAVTITIAY